MADGDATAIREVAEAAETTAREQTRVAAIARRIADQRQAGVPWVAITQKGAIRALIDSLGAGAIRLRGAGAKLRRAWARGLLNEGLTTRQVGQRFGISHQRVSALLSRQDDG